MKFMQLAQTSGGTTNPSMTEIKTLVDHASTQSDRWLFIALLVIGLFAIWMLGKYFTRRIESGELKHDARMAAAEAKYDVLNTFVRNELTTLIVKNTTALESHTRFIQRCQENSDRRASNAINV